MKTINNILSILLLVSFTLVSTAQNCYDAPGDYATWTIPNLPNGSEVVEVSDGGSVFFMKNQKLYVGYWTGSNWSVGLVSDQLPTYSSSAYNLIDTKYANGKLYLSMYDAGPNAIWSVYYNSNTSSWITTKVPTSADVQVMSEVAAGGNRVFYQEIGPGSKIHSVFFNGFIWVDEGVISLNAEGQTPMDYVDGKLFYLSPGGVPSFARRKKSGVWINKTFPNAPLAPTHTGYGTVAKFVYTKSDQSLYYLNAYNGLISSNSEIIKLNLATGSWEELNIFGHPQDFQDGKLFHVNENRQPSRAKMDGFGGWTNNTLDCSIVNPITYGKMYYHKNTKHNLFFSNFSSGSGLPTAISWTPGNGHRVDASNQETLAKEQEDLASHPADNEKRFMPNTNEIACYPMPFNNQLNLEITPRTSGNCQMQLFNQLGKLVHQQMQQVDENSIQKISIHTTTLESGIYYLKVSIDGVLVQTKKTILQR